MLQLAALGDFQELPGAAQQVLVVLGGLEVVQGALGGPDLEGGGGGLIPLDDALADGVVQDGGEGCGGAEELALQLIPQVVPAHPQQLGGGACALPGQALDGHIPQGQPLHLVGLLGGAAHGKAAAHQQGIRGRLAEVLLLVLVAETGPHRAVVLNHKVHGGSPDGVHVRAVLDVGGGVHPHLAAQAGDVGHPLALGGQGLLDGVGPGGVCAPLALRCALAALAGGAGGLGVDGLLAALELGLFLGGEAAVLGAGLVHQGLLTGKCFGFVHAVVTSFCSG